ncbi:MAG TPA: replicative DNA helicase [Elusimicrobia bacterium]|nr:replicative DNA helicase [Elusimicrobiota bacterium]
MVTISNSQIDLIAPNNIEAERAVLGSMLIEKEAIEIAMDTLSENDFYLTAHKIIFREIIDTYDRNKGDVDIILINDHLKSNAEITRLGGSVYLTSLVDTVITASNVEYYAKIVKDKAVLRELEHAGRKIIGDATTIGISDVSEVVDKVAQMIFNISEKRVLKGPVSISDMINPALDNIEAIYQNKEQVPGIPSGFADLDKITGGFKKSNFIIIAGRPSTGKTSFCLNIAENIALLHNKPVLIFSLEMSNDELFNRFLCSQARVASDRVRNGYLSKDDWPRITTAAGKLKEAKIFLDDSSSLHVLEMKSRARRLDSEIKGIGLIIIDYLQLMSGKTGRSEYRQQEVAEISRSLKVMAKDLKVPVIALSQLSREPEKRTGNQVGRPRLADLRESGAIEQDADLVLMIYQPAMYKPDGIEASSPICDAEILVAKNRNGKTGTVNLRFFKEYTRFENASK